MPCSAFLLLLAGALFPAPYGSQKPDVGSQVVRFENRIDVPVRIVSAVLTETPSGIPEIDFSVENTGNLPIKEFDIAFPDGDYGFGFEMLPGQRLNIDAEIESNSKKTLRMLSQGELGSWVFVVSSITWSDSAGVPINLDLSIRNEDKRIGLAWESQPIYFPREPVSKDLDRFQSGVSGYARVTFGIENKSDDYVTELQCEFQGEVDGEWRRLSGAGIGTIGPHKTESVSVAVPIDIAEGGVQRRVSSVRLVATRVTVESAESRIMIPLPPRKDRGKDVCEQCGIVTLVSGTDGDIDSEASLLSPARAPYTAEAVKDQIEGIAILQVLIGADGAAKDVRISIHLPEGLDEEAIRAVYGSKFKPAEKGGQPIDCWQTIKVSFMLK